MSYNSENSLKTENKNQLQDNVFIEETWKHGHEMEVEKLSRVMPRHIWESFGLTLSLASTTKMEIEVGFVPETLLANRTHIRLFLSMLTTVSHSIVLA